MLEPFPIKTISLKDKSYPARLKILADPPPLLYYRGALPLDSSLLFAIVGTRNASDYGKETALWFSQKLSRAGFIIVSGLAEGIDSYAHQGALNEAGQTIAILGTGLAERTIYPQSNLKLAQKILKQGGCLISELSPDTPGAKFTFPKRNRIISAISLGVLVVEAKNKSGSLITAQYAKKQKRPLWAVPGSIYSPNSQGCHELIKRGAQIANNPADIIRTFNIKTKNLARTDCQNDLALAIIKLLESGNCTIDQIITQTNYSSPEISAALALLEIEGHIKSLGGSIYALQR